jgi:purine-binding chemotaxis protein CheW
VGIEIWSVHAFSGDGSHQLMVFSLDERRYALRLQAVEQVVRVVEITALPQAPQVVLGVVNLRGQVVPVFDIRERFRLPKREVALSDQLIVARANKRRVALVVDGVEGVVTRPDDEITRTAQILPGLDYVDGAMKLEDGLVFIHDLNTFLSIEEDKELEQALNVSGPV